LEETAVRLSAENRIAVDVLARSGNPVGAILAAAQDIHADLIVVGKARTMRRDTMTFGATVVALARKTTIPLLIVPQTMACIAPKAIALAKELSGDDTHAALRELQGYFGSRLYFLGVKPNETGETIEVYRADAIHSVKELFHLLYEIPVDNRLRHSMENFIEAAPLHLLAVRPIPGLTPERWLLNGRSKELAFDVRVPLLVLPEPEKITARRGRRSS
jgi:hypothetical protein